jgi:hypothetical protein
MRYIKTFEAKKVITPGDIKKICDKYKIENYTINSDGTVDVDGYLDISRTDLTKLPLKFRNVTGDVYINYNKLTSLVGSPQTVGWGFDCSNNQLTTLEGAPKTVGGYFDCSDNQLTTLKGSPENINSDFDCSNNELINFNGFPEYFDANFIMSNNPVEEIYDLFKTVKCVKWLNEYDVIQDNKVVLERLEMVYEQLGIDIINLKGYEII